LDKVTLHDLVSSEKEAAKLLYQMLEPDPALKRSLMNIVSPQE
jgi:hypothetical protein